MNIEKMRSEFEAKYPPQKGVAWHGGAYHLFNQHDCTKLEHRVYLMRWETWQQSRSSLVIELPTYEYANDANEYSKGHRQGIRACREAIQSTGVKVK